MRFFDCWLHLFIVCSIVAYTTAQMFFYSSLSAKNNKLSNEVKGKFARWFVGIPNANKAYFFNIVFHFALWLLYVNISHCWACTILIILFLLWLILTTGFLFWRNNIVKLLVKLAKKIKNPKRKAKWVRRTNNWKNEIEFDDSAVTFNDGYNSASVLSAKKSIDFDSIIKSIMEFGHCEVRKNNFSRLFGVVRNKWSVYCFIEGENKKIRKRRFALIFDLKKNKGKDSGALLFLRMDPDPRDRNEIYRFYPEAAVSKYPLGREYISFPITEFVSSESCKIFLKKAFDYSVKVLEEQEFEKNSKKLKV